MTWHVYLKERSNTNITTSSDLYHICIMYFTYQCRFVKWSRLKSLSFVFPTHNIQPNYGYTTLIIYTVCTRRRWDIHTISCLFAKTNMTLFSINGSLMMAWKKNYISANKGLPITPYVNAQCNLSHNLKFCFCLPNSLSVQGVNHINLHE